jgi:hypothetical protein
MFPSEQHCQVELLCNEEIAPAIDSILQTANLKIRELIRGYVAYLDQELNNNAD